MADPAYVIVTAPDGTSVARGAPRVDGPVVSQDITSGPDGTYTMAYRVVSEDGHPLAGEITFTVGATSAAGPSGTGPTPAEPSRDGEAAAGVPPAGSPDETLWSRQHVAVSVAVALFGLAALLLLLARRTGGGSAR
jgi:hypothetical protein